MGHDAFAIAWTPGGYRRRRADDGGKGVSREVDRSAQA